MCLNCAFIILQVMLTGHGGDEFMKFADDEEVQ